jgi:hypothetical protein
MPWITTLTDRERADLIAARRRDSAFWRAVHWGSSLHLAMILLITLAIACAVATVTESRFSSEVARYYIYKAPWFGFWLLFLVVNLLCVIVGRWPWQRKHLSFIVAHIGIITLLSGAVIGQKWGYEGFLNLEVGHPPEGRVILNQTVLDIRPLGTATSYEAPFPVEVRRPSEAHPRVLPLPHSPLRLSIDRYAENLSFSESLVPSAAPGAGPGAGLRFVSHALKQDFSWAVLQNDPARHVRDFFGMASVEWSESFAVPSTAKLALRISAPRNGEVPFQLLREGKPYAQGVLKPGIPISLGWADWQVTLLASAPQAGVHEEIAEGDANAPDATPGVRASLLDNGRVIDGPLWIPSGQAQSFTTPAGPLAVGFGLKTHPLPFTVGLLKFDVPRDEGTETPADFIATVRFQDFAGRTRIGEAHMNYPASFPGGFWDSVIGQNYKFSQASWNPMNLNQTTLQILFDPGWPFKWIGSILIVCGIALLFYYKPQRRTP